MKRGILTFAAGLVTISMSVNAFAGIRLNVDGNDYNRTDLGEPFIDSNSRTMVPLRSAAYALGLSDNDVVWNNETKTAVFTKEKTDGSSVRVSFAIGEKSCGISSTDTDGKTTDKKTDMDTKAVIKEGRTYAPIRYLAEAFGYTVGWNADTSTINLSSQAITTDEALGILNEIFGTTDYDTGLSNVFGYDKTVLFNGQKYYAFNLFLLQNDILVPKDVMFVKYDGQQVWDGKYDDSTGKYTMYVYDDTGKKSEVLSD